MQKSGKSFLLDLIFKKYLPASGVKEDHIIESDLDENSLDL